MKSKYFHIGYVTSTKNFQKLKFTKHQNDLGAGPVQFMTASHFSCSKFCIMGHTGDQLCDDIAYVKVNLILL